MLSGNLDAQHHSTSTSSNLGAQHHNNNSNLGASAATSPTSMLSNTAAAQLGRSSSNIKNTFSKYMYYTSYSGYILIKNNGANGIVKGQSISKLLYSIVKLLYF